MPPTSKREREREIDEPPVRFVCVCGWLARAHVCVLLSRLRRCGRLCCSRPRRRRWAGERAVRKQGARHRRWPPRRGRCRSGSTSLSWNPGKRRASQTTSRYAPPSKRPLYTAPALSPGAAPPFPCVCVCHTPLFPPPPRPWPLQPATVEAMRRLVAYMVGETNPEKIDEFSLERGSLASLCLWQLVTGYRLRDAEATGKANELRGL